MQIEQMRWLPAEDAWQIENSDMTAHEVAQLILIFTDTACISGNAALEDLKLRYPAAHVVGCSGAGNILGAESSDNDMVATAVFFEKSRVEVKAIEADSSTDIARLLANAVTELRYDDLRHLLVLSDGLNFNGSEIAKGIGINEGISVTGGLAGDNERFQQTFVITDGSAKSKQIALIAFYGKDLCVEHGCYAGWNEFGVTRKITKSIGNVVYEIDHQPALQLYKNYLDDLAEGLPGSGLRFPLSIQNENENGVPLIRTLLSVDEKAQSLTFAGDVSEGATALLMKGNADDLILGAKLAAKQACGKGPGLAIIISCVGRRMLMDQLSDDELVAVQDSLGGGVMLAGFYSYGELASCNGQCQLHNQTMTLFVLYEK